jgi:hypothetical protein
LVLANLNAIRPNVLEDMILGAWRQVATRKQLAVFDQARERP